MNMLNKRYFLTIDSLRIVKPGYLKYKKLKI